MKYHLVTSTFFDFKEFYRKFHEDLGPRHTIFEVGQKLGAEIFQPDTSARVGIINWILSKIVGQPSHWLLARAVLKNVSTGDVIYCTGQDIGTPMAILIRLLGIKAKLGIFFLDPESRRTKYLFKIFNLNKIVNLFAITDRYKLQILIDQYGVAQDSICLLPEQTDELFFRPDAGTINTNRFLIACAGMEQRDYLTLAQAIEGLDVEVKVCAHSPNLSKNTNFRFPDVTPENMEVRYFEFVELRDLYRSADLVVISLLENTYSAGLTVLMEAVACRKPVIITNNSGLGREFIEKGLTIGVQPGDAEELKQKMQEVMQDSSLAGSYAAKAHDYFLKFHTSNIYVDLLADRLSQLSEKR